MRDWVILLRGVNVGGRQPVRMAALRAALASAGFELVESYLQSGNLVARSSLGKAALADGIRSAFRSAAGFDTAVVLRDAEEWRRLVDGNPFSAEAADPTKVHAAVLDGQPAPERLAELLQLANGERVEEGQGVLYLHAPAGIGRSRLVQRMEAVLAIPLTMRNWRTVLALRDMLVRRKALNN